MWCVSVAKKPDPWKDSLSLFNAASQLFERGQMRGLAILFEQNDPSAREALRLFLEKHGTDLGKMVQGKPTSLGITFVIKTDKGVGRKENTTPFKNAAKAEAHEIGRLLIYAGAKTLMKNAVADISTKTKRGETWVTDRWREFNEYYDTHILVTPAEDPALRMAEFRPVTSSGLTEEQLDKSKQLYDPRDKWQREYDSGKVNYTEFSDKYYSKFWPKKG